MNGFLNFENDKIQNPATADTIFDNADVIAEIASIDGSLWRLCLHPLEYKRNLNPNLDSLVESGSTNPFFNPAFIAASRDRILHKQIYQLIVWEIAGNTPTPRFAVPLSKVHKRFWLRSHYQSLTHPFAPYGDPLLDKIDHDEVLTKLSELLRKGFKTGLEPIVFEFLPAFSEFLNIKRHSDEEIYTHTRIQGRRASLSKASANSGKAFASKKRERELRRLERKLEEEGEISYQHAKEPIEIMLRFEEFLLMETKGWKGRKATSIHVIKRHAAFARQAVNDLAKLGLCEIVTMRFNGSPIASIILFHTNGHYFPWKISYDHLFAKFSPGSRLMSRLTSEITALQDFQNADSLAVFGNSWMNHLWPDETEYFSMTLACSEEDARKLAHRKAQKDRLKSWIKKIVFRD